MNTFKIVLDGKEVEVQSGQTVLDAARHAGIEIPTLCFLKKCGPLTACLVCLVKVIVNGQGRMVPSCGTKVFPGMTVQSETQEVREARRTALELLLSDHVGDCLSPCHRLCPLQLNIPVMIRQIHAGQVEDAFVTIRQSLPLPRVLGRLCHHPCEQGCRRGSIDDPAAIREMERFASDHAAEAPVKYLPPRRAATHKSVVIVGAGPAGLAAADVLARAGHNVTVVDRNDRAGGTLRTQPSKEELPADVLETDIARLAEIGIQLKLSVELGHHVTIEGLLRGFDAVLLTLGATAKPDGEKLGVALTPTGIKADANNFQTSVAKVFAAGAAVKPVKQAVRAMAEGQAAAECVDQFLSGMGMARREKPFSCMMGRLDPEELKLFLQGARPGGAVACGGCSGFTPTEAVTEASRCLHCDCRSAGSCILQKYAQEYGADAGRFRAERRLFEQQEQPGGIIYEPGKCILCGICVKLAEQAREPLGLTFIGRGFDVRVGVPFGRAVEEGLRKVAEECVNECPTGALTFKDKPNFF